MAYCSHLTTPCPAKREITTGQEILGRFFDGILFKYHMSSPEHLGVHPVDLRDRNSIVWAKIIFAFSISSLCATPYIYGKETVDTLFPSPTPQPTETPTPRPTRTPRPTETSTPFGFKPTATPTPDDSDEGPRYYPTPIPEYRDRGPRLSCVLIWGVFCPDIWK